MCTNVLKYKYRVLFWLSFFNTRTDFHILTLFFLYKIWKSVRVFIHSFIHSVQIIHTYTSWRPGFTSYVVYITIYLYFMRSLLRTRVLLKSPNLVLVLVPKVLPGPFTHSHYSRESIAIWKLLHTGSCRAISVLKDGQCDGLVFSCAWNRSGATHRTLRSFQIHM